MSVLLSGYFLRVFNVRIFTVSIARILPGNVSVVNVDVTLLGDDVGITLAPTARGLWFDPR